MFEPDPADTNSMTPALSNSDAFGFLGNLSAGFNHARCLMAAFLSLAFVLAFYSIWRVWCSLIRLNKKAQQSLVQDEDDSGAPHHDLKRDVWTN